MIVSNLHYKLKTAAKKLKINLSDYASRRKHSAHLRESTSRANIGVAGPLATFFNDLKSIPGWFNLDDCAHFYLLLTQQSLAGIRGNLFEIGSYNGRSTALMAKCLQDDESLIVCDAFEFETEDFYFDRPSPKRLRQNVHRLNPTLAREQLVIHHCLSNDLQLEPAQIFRFIHIDGGHSATQVLFDLNLCSKYLLAGGIMVVDDYAHPDWPGVTQGTDSFLENNACFEVLADLNRHGAIGRKLYLVKV